MTTLSTCAWILDLGAARRCGQPCAGMYCDEHAQAPERLTQVHAPDGTRPPIVAETATSGA